MRAFLVLFLIFLYTTSLIGQSLSGGSMHYSFNQYFDNEDSLFYRISTELIYNPLNSQIIPQPWTTIYLTTYKKENSDYFYDGFEFSDLENSYEEILMPSFSCEINNFALIKKGKYITNFAKLPNTSEEFVFVIQRCCRSLNLSNIVNPPIDSLVGHTFFSVVLPTAYGLMNSNPIIENLPAPLVCRNQSLNYSFGATDIDNDSLTYEFAPIYNGAGITGSNYNDCDFPHPIPPCPPPFDLTEFLPPYTAQSPLGDNVTLNPQTGQLEGTITELGTFALGIVIKEYRNGILIGETHREMHLNVIDCAEEITAAIVAEDLGDSHFLIESCNSLTVELENISSDTVFVEDWFYEFEINNATMTFTEWSPIISFPEAGIYQGILVLNPSQVCSDTAYIEIVVSQDLEADFVYEYDTCLVAPIHFTSLSNTPFGNIETQEWLFGNGNVIEGGAEIDYLYEESGLYEVSLVVTDNSGCRDTITKDISFFPIPPLLIIEPSAEVGCFPLFVEFNNLTPFVDSTYSFFWDFGDGNFSELIQPTHTYTEAGDFDVHLRVVSSFDCEIEETFSSLVHVGNFPEADFDYSPQTLNSLASEATFIDNSLFANEYLWQINEEFVSSASEFSFDFSTVGIYEIQLIVKNEYNCEDSIIKTLVVDPKVSFFFPNAFTPNGDGKNDIFKGKGAGLLEEVSDYSLKIWNRWGELIFESFDINEGWSGRDKNSNRLAPQAVYTFRSQMTSPSGEMLEFSGSLLLVK